MAHWAYVVGIVIGGAAVIISATVWLKKQKFGAGGATLSLVGLVLIGLPVWSSVKLTLPGGGGLDAQFRELRLRVEQVAGATQQISQEVATLANISETTRAAFGELTGALEAQQPLRPDHLQMMRARVLDSGAIDHVKLERANRVLSPKP